MKLKLITYYGEEKLYDATSFEFRTNQVENWIRIKTSEGETIMVYNVCVIKTIE